MNFKNLFFAAILVLGFSACRDTAKEDHGHEHDSDFDVSLFELTANWFKQIQNTIIFTLSLILFVTSAIVVWPPPHRKTLYQRHTYWRPVLRGPPVLH